MKIRVEIKQSYHSAEFVFRGWATARDWILEALLAGEPGTEVVLSIPADEPELLMEMPKADTDFND